MAGQVWGRMVGICVSDLATMLLFSFKTQFPLERYAESNRSNVLGFSVPSIGSLTSSSHQIPLHNVASCHAASGNIL